jgi:hypothetical protein
LDLSDLIFFKKNCAAFWGDKKTSVHFAKALDKALKINRLFA